MIREFRELFNSNKVFNNLSSYKLGNLTLNEEALLIAYYYSSNDKPVVIVKKNLFEAQRLQELIQPLLEEKVLLFSVEPSMRITSINTSIEEKANSISTITEIIDCGKPLIITHTAGLVYKLPLKEVFKSFILDINVNDILNLKDLKKKLVEMGYFSCSFVDEPLYFSNRGGIIDVFPANCENPIRIEFFDNIVESIREFDIETKKSIKELDKVKIFPACDILFNENQRKTIVENLEVIHNDNDMLKTMIEEDICKINENIIEAKFYQYYKYIQTGTIIDYVENSTVFISTIEDIEEEYNYIFSENVEYIREQYLLSNMLEEYNVFYSLDYYKNSNYIIFSRFMDQQNPISLDITPVYSPQLTLELKLDELIKESNKYKVAICIDKKYQKNMLNVLKEKNIIYKYNSHMDENGIYIYDYDLEEGFSYDEHIFYSQKELINQERINTRYSKNYKKASILTNYTDLNEKDYVVHYKYGVGQYIGIVTRKHNNYTKDYLRIIYRGNDELLVPLEQFQLVRKFVSREGVVPKLNKLGSDEWEKTKNRVSKNVEELAEKLVDIYSQRVEHIGFSYSKDNELIKQFEDEFEYDLTQDQVTSIREIKNDMESSKPMDRLLCGDVGFGKTEVALRAAFKAVLDNKQVAFICPTTILSKQHYKTFMKRLVNYPVNVKLLNRFTTSKEKTVLMKELKEGTVDIVIGTHALLNKKIEFKDLGFLVIDEEQRFGVKHKESIKEMKVDVDVLALSATPIPRSLQMSLIGVRSLSQLTTPPLMRTSVQTYVVEKNEHLIKEVIQRELSRKGQVFYVYNNSREIFTIAHKLSLMMPTVKIGVVHGKMSKDEIDDVMNSFINNDYQVLVSTSIIETGIDISNANTIIIDRADTFGLSQLYQLKGRVGRSKRVAFAYLMYSKDKQMSDIAYKRLKSIKDFAQLGSGYKIAMRDLTIRGAGDLLGPKQAGFIDTVGIDMYLELLNEAILKRKGEYVHKEIEAKENIPIEAYIPEKFSNEDSEKIAIYQNIDLINEIKQLNDYEEFLIDNYGKLPFSVLSLFEKRKFEILKKNVIISKAIINDNYIRIVFSKEWSKNIDGVKYFEGIIEISSEIKLKFINGCIDVTINDTINKVRLCNEVIELSINI